MTYLLPKPRHLRSLANRYVLPSMEALFYSESDRQLQHPPIFILGAPRCGSTLAIQVLTSALDIGYLSNQHCRWYGAPAVFESLFKPAPVNGDSDYTSVHGETSGDYGPAECGEWWYRFFRRDPAYVSISDVERNKMMQFRRSTGAIIKAFKRPVVFKNLYTSLRLRPVSMVLPESLFLVIHRNEVDNAHSILEARYKLFGDYGKWLSVPPPNYADLCLLPAHEQVLEQVRSIYKTINGDLKCSGWNPARRLDIDYEVFCENPHQEIQRVDDFFQSHGCNVKRKNKIPSAFSPRREVRIDPSLYDNLLSYSLATAK